MFGIKITKESELETRLIEQLTSGVSQWVYRPDLRTEEDLWNNFREKLEQNNKAILKGAPITDAELNQIKGRLNFATFFDAAKWLVGENGIARVTLQREDASLGTVNLDVLRRQDVAGGTSSYEVINQYQADKRRKIERDRRFDVTLLINGLPMIHIELKNHAHAYMEGFEQIKKYLKEGHFKGIFSALQMFVVSNGVDTRYIATAQDTKLNEQFLIKWVAEDNVPVIDYLSFAKEVLSIPMAHKMVTQYTVVDNERKSLILLRPYQIHAIEAIRSASKRQESGYIWHTTGSGKTLTSYKVARNLLSIPSIEKTVFVVDRVDLDQQTSSAFLSYAENDVIDVKETNNVTALEEALISSERRVIVTTIQKLNRLMDSYSEESTIHTKKAQNAQKLHNLKLAFVVDECHRAVTPQMQEIIKKFFCNSLWYGFTGTPIFKENAREERGNLARTTEQQYGKCLHKYTVKEAIKDKAVLGFQVTYHSTIPSDELDAYLETEMKINRDKINRMSPLEKERNLDSKVYLNENHMWYVVQAIVNESSARLGLNRGAGNTYSALLTTSSIVQAQRYYEMFKVVKEGTAPVKIDKKIKRLLPDFPKVAITYSVTENDANSSYNQDRMKECLEDYYEEFGEPRFDMSQLRSYNRNVNERLARKEEKYLKRSNQLDLVIVVDRLLTGFDAPCLSTLFVDRQPMREQNLIQAFSRTNRLFDKNKRYGQIVTFQYPELFKAQVEQAIFLYSNGGENDVLAPDWKEAKKRFKAAIIRFREVEPSIPGGDVSVVNTSTLKRYVKTIKELDKTFIAVQVYDEYSPELLESEFKLSMEELEYHSGIYQNALAELQSRCEKDDSDHEEYDISYELEAISVERIDYEYILNVIQSFVPQDKGQDVLIRAIDSSTKDEVNNYLGTLAKLNPQLSNILTNIWKDLQSNPSKYRGKFISELVATRLKDMEDKFVSEFALEWCLDVDNITYIVENYNYRRNDGEIDGMQMLKEDTNSNYEIYKQAKLDRQEKPVPKLVYFTTVKSELINMIKSKILPLRKK